MKRLMPILLAGLMLLSVLPASGDMAGGLLMPVSAPSGLRLTALSLRESRGDGWCSPAAGNVFVVVRFRAENGTGSELSISSVVDFEVWADGMRVSWSQGASMACAPSLECTISAGRQAEGELAWEVPASWQTLEIRYRPGITIVLTRQDMWR